jgi:hypothetical protein
MSTPSNPIIGYNPDDNLDYALETPVCGSSTNGSNPEFANFTALIRDANSLTSSRRQMNADSARWDVIARTIGLLVRDANAANLSGNQEQRSKIYGQIMLIITAEYLPVVSDFLGDQIAEQAAIQNIASDVSAFIIDAQTGFNNLSACPDSTQCDDNLRLYSGVMALIAGSSSSIPENDYSFTVTINGVASTQSNIINFLTDVGIWGSTSTTPLTSSEASQIISGLGTIPTLFNTFQPLNGTGTDPNSWNLEDYDTIDNDILMWTQPYPINGGKSCGGDCATCNSSNTTGGTTGGCTGCDCDPTTSDDCSCDCDNTDCTNCNTCYCSNNAPLVYTQPNSLQEGINQASQAVETVATSTQTVENFQIQEIDQFYGITNSIQQSQEQQCAAMVKQQTA